MSQKILSLLLGTSLILYGIFTIIQRGYYSSKFDFYFDFGPYHYLLGAFITIVGVLFVYTSLRTKAKAFEDDILICPKCEASFNRKDITDQNCPQCNVKLEELEGFYERHPALKTNNKE